MTKTIKTKTAERRYIEISEIPNYALNEQGGLPTELALDGWLWRQEATERDGEGEIILWTYAEIDNPTHKLIIFND